MKHRTNRALFSYWNNVRGDRIAPQRFEIDPSRISAILPHTFILERLSAETMRFRLAGTHICDLFGTELRGSNFFDGWAAIDRLPLLRQFSVLTSQGAVMVLYVKLITADNESVECEVVLLPLVHTRGCIDRVLGTCAPLAHPSWVGVKPVTGKYLMANELVWPARDPRPVLEQAPVSAPPVEANVFGTQSARIVRSQGRNFRVLDGGLTRRDLDEV